MADRKEANESRSESWRSEAQDGRWARLGWTRCKEEASVEGAVELNPGLVDQPRKARAGRETCRTKGRGGKKMRAGKEAQTKVVMNNIQASLGVWGGDGLGEVGVESRDW